MKVFHRFYRQTGYSKLDSLREIWKLERVSRVALGCCIGLLFTFGLVWGAGSGVPDCRYPEGLPGAPSITVSTDAAEVGDTRFFWAYAHGFFAGYYGLSATCQTIGEQAYLFTEDAYINDLACSPTAVSETIYAASLSGVFKSMDGGLNWSPAIAGLPDADGPYDSFDSTNYNRRAPVYCLFSRAEYGESFDTVWVGTEYGPFWSTAEPDTFRKRISNMATDPDTDDKPATYDILGHPTENRTLWCATNDGVYMTRNANRWYGLSHGLPPGEGAIWDAEPAYALAYENDYLFANTSKGAFYGTVRALGDGEIASWKPLGGTVEFDTIGVSPAVEDTLWLIVPDTTSIGFSITAGQNVTFIDISRDIYLAGFVDETPAGLTVILTEDDIFYYPEGETPPEIDFTLLELENLVAYGYNPNTGPALMVESEDETVTIWLGSSDGGLISGTYSGDISMGYDPDSVVTVSSHEDYQINQIKKKEDLYYFSTDQGLFSATDPHGEWTRMTGYVYNNNSSDSVAVHTMAVSFSGTSVYTGGYLGGFLHSEDGVTFDHSNMGLIHLNGTSDQLGSFLNEFENSTPDDPDKGIYDTEVEWWGELPTGDDDIDGDSKIIILFLNIDDMSTVVNAPDDTPMTGYFDGRNEFALSGMAQSNQMEMFYLDTDPQMLNLWINRAGAAACNQMFNLINWNQDFLEDRWLREGLSAFAQHVAGYSVADDTIQFPQINEMLNWGDQKANIEQIYTFLIVLYLYEQYFPDVEGEHSIAEVASSTYRGASGLGQLIYEKGGGISDDSTDYTPVFASLFTDFILACAIDISDTTFYGGKYGFSAVNTEIAPISYTWYLTPTTTPPFRFHQPFWSARAIQVDDQSFFNAGPNGENAIDEVVVNGDDRNQLQFYLLYAFADEFVPEMQPDEVVLIEIPTDSVKQKGRIVLPDSLVLDGTATYPNLMRMIAICSSNLEDGPSCFTFGDDYSTPENLFLTLTQNPVDDQFIDIYSFANRRLYPDGGQLYRVEALGLTNLEGPAVDITGAISENTGEEITITLDQDVFYVNPQANTYTYHVAYHLDNIELPADLEFVAYGEDVIGNEKESDPLNVSVDFIEGTVGGTVRNESSSASVHIPPLAMSDDAYILLSVVDIPGDMTSEVGSRGISAPIDLSHQQIGPLVSAGSAGIGLSIPIELEIPYDASLAGMDDVGVYRSDGDGWIYIGGTPDSEENVLRTYSWKFGQFQAFAGPLNDMQPELPYSFGLEQNYPNPFNPSTQIQFEITSSQRVKVDIYNLTGQRVGTIADGIFDAGRHSLLWQPKVLSSGVYFLRLEAGEGVLYRKMVLLK